MLGFAAGARLRGIKTPGPGKLDLGDPRVGSRRPTVAAMFTRNTVKGAAVIVSQRNARNGRARGVIVNAGISNVATGARGHRERGGDVRARRGAGSAAMPRRLLVGSTGVIGRPLPIDKIRAGVPRIDIGAGRRAASSRARS